jgi:hypothetical protein
MPGFVSVGGFSGFLRLDLSSQPEKLFVHAIEFREWRRRRIV